MSYKNTRGRVPTGFREIRAAGINIMGRSGGKVFGKGHRESSSEMTVGNDNLECTSGKVFLGIVIGKRHGE